jgi:putative transposase
MVLPKIIGWFKMNSAKQINQIRKTPGTPVWQRNYYEHIIRNEKELHSIREYIKYNPLKWDEDEENTD